MKSMSNVTSAVDQTMLRAVRAVLVVVGATLSQTIRYSSSLLSPHARVLISELRLHPSPTLPLTRISPTRDQFLHCAHLIMISKPTT